MNDVVALSRDRVAQLRDLFDSIPVVALLGLELVNIEQGLVEVRMEVRDQFRQNRAVLHGGITAALIDTATSFAVAGFLHDGEGSTTIDLTIHYLKALTGGSVTAKARVERAGGTILTVSAEVLDQNGNLAATALSSYMRLRPR